ncbi:hypothetical protein [Phytohalomonas tamaricis]|uniref:hypothetical protein n=1 Tax=Phytohalomonas tamaricis TaxID=2081032 RepID=UPI000D0B0F59|nr:hypothetical protein [Phytohalomonas tamaricis]
MPSKLFFFAAFCPTVLLSASVLAQSNSSAAFSEREDAQGKTAQQYEPSSSQEREVPLRTEPLRTQRIFIDRAHQNDSDTQDKSSLPTQAKASDESKADK